MATSEETLEPREWIEKRYGDITIETRTVVVAGVKVMGGLAFGLGVSEEEALKALKADLKLEGPGK